MSGGYCIIKKEKSTGQLTGGEKVREGRAMEMTVYNAMETIIQQGEPGECMYYVLAGKVGVFLNYATPAERKLSELGEQQFFGEMSLLNDEPRSATVIALEDNTCVQLISKKNFRAFCAEYPEMVFSIMQQLSQRLRAATSRD